MLLLPEESFLKLDENIIKQVVSCWEEGEWLSVIDKPFGIVLNREPTEIIYSQRTNGFGFIFWRWLAAPSNWETPITVNLTDLNKLGSHEFLSSNNEWVMIDPNDCSQDQEHFYRFQVNKGRWIATTYTFEKPHDVEMILHAFICKNKESSLF